MRKIISGKHCCIITRMWKVYSITITVLILSCAFNCLLIFVEYFRIMVKVTFRFVNFYQYFKNLNRELNKYATQGHKKIGTVVSVVFIRVRTQ